MSAEPGGGPEGSRWLREHELEKPEDLKRLHPHDYADLAARPASHLDIVRMQLQVNEALAKFGQALNVALQALEEERRRLAEAVPRVES